MFKILAINPGSTSTKIGIFEDGKLIHESNFMHSSEELAKYPTIEQEIAFRRQVIDDALKSMNIDLASFAAISCRGGIIKPVPSGVYRINEAILEDSKHSTYKHPSNLTALIGFSLGEQYGIPSFITDPPSTFEATDIAVISGHPLFKRPMTFHALNHKAVAKKHCKVHGLDYEKVNLIVAHIGGGISIGMHHHGRVIDVTDAISEGPFSPERSGALPTKLLIELFLSGKYDEKFFRGILRGNGGFQAYLGTNDLRKVIKMIEEGHQDAALLFEAFVYQVAKEIGAMATITNGEVDGIILTGGICHSHLFTHKVIDRIKWIAPVFVSPGEEELQALNDSVLAVLFGKDTAKTYV